MAMPTLVSSLSKSSARKEAPRPASYVVGGWWILMRGGVGAHLLRIAHSVHGSGQSCDGHLTYHYDEDEVKDEISGLGGTVLVR